MKGSECESSGLSVQYLAISPPTELWEKLDHIVVRVQGVPDVTLYVGRNNLCVLPPERGHLGFKFHTVLEEKTNK